MDCFQSTIQIPNVTQWQYKYNIVMTISVAIIYIGTYRYVLVGMLKVELFQKWIKSIPKYKNLIYFEGYIDNKMNCLWKLTN